MFETQKSQKYEEEEEEEEKEKEKARMEDEVQYTYLIAVWKGEDQGTEYKHVLFCMLMYAVRIYRSCMYLSARFLPKTCTVHLPSGLWRALP